MTNTLRARTTIVFVSAFSVLCATARTSQAQLLLYEPFNYEVGTGLGGGQGGTMTAPVGYTNASTGTQWHAHQVGSGYTQSLDAQIATGSLSYGNLATSGNSVSAGSGAAGASNRYADGINLPAQSRPGEGSLSVYFSFLVHLNSQVQNNGTIDGSRFGFAELSTRVLAADGLPLSIDAQNSGLVPMPGTLWMRPDITAGGQPTTHSQFGIGKSNTDAISAAGSATWMQNGLAAPTAGSTRQGVNTTPWDQTYFIVGKYTFNDPAFTSLPGGFKNNQRDSVSIYVNPQVADLGNNAGEASAVTTALYSATGGAGTATVDTDVVNSFVLLGHRQTGSVGNVSAAFTFDELRIGLTWADVTPVSAGIVGDYNNNGAVDAADYVVWRKKEGTTDLLPNDPIGGTIGPAQYNQWREHFGQPPGSGSGSAGTLFLQSAVPEPGAVGVVAVAIALLGGWRRR
jgi:hypothetical protein